MDKLQQSNRTKAVREYLRGVGIELNTTQAYEVLARSLGYKNKHVLAAASATDTGRAVARLPRSIEVDGSIVPVMALTDSAFSVDKMQALGWELDVVIPFSLDQFENVEAMNDYASQRITGSDVALEDIRYDHVPGLDYGKGWVAYRVTGQVSDPEAHFPEVESEQERCFYSELLEFAQLLGDRTSVVLAQANTFSVSAVLGEVSRELVALLETYARTTGLNNDEVNRHGAEVLAWCRPHDSGYAPIALVMADLKYATKVAAGCWSLDIGGSLVELRFID